MTKTNERKRKTETSINYILNNKRQRLNQTYNIPELITCTVSFSKLMTDICQHNRLILFHSSISAFNRLLVSKAKHFYVCWYGLEEDKQTLDDDGNAISWMELRPGV